MRNKIQTSKTLVGALSPIRNPRTGVPLDIAREMSKSPHASESEMLADYWRAHSGRLEENAPAYNVSLTPEEIHALVEKYAVNGYIYRQNQIAEAIRCLLAENPNAAIDDVVRLLGNCPDFVQKNIALPILMLMDVDQAQLLSPALYELLYTSKGDMAEDLARIEALVRNNFSRDPVGKLYDLYVRFNIAGHQLVTRATYERLMSLWKWCEKWVATETAYVILRRSSIPKLLQKKAPLAPENTLSSKDVSKSTRNPPGIPELSPGTKILLVWTESVAKSVIHSLVRGAQKGEEIFVAVPIQIKLDEMQPLTHEGVVRKPFGYEDGYLYAAFKEATVSRARLDLSAFEGGSHRAPAPAQATPSSSRYDIARSIREDLKRLAADPHWKGLTTSVTGDHNSIRVKITKLPHTISRLYDMAKFLQMSPRTWGGQSDRLRESISPAYTALHATIESIVNHYHWDKSDISTDYFNSNFYKSVELDYTIQSQEGKSLEADLMARASDPTIKPSELAHLANIFRYETIYGTMQEKKPLMIAIGTNPQVARTTPEEYKEIAEFCGVNLTVPHRRQQPRVRLAPGPRPLPTPDPIKHVPPMKRPRPEKPAPVVTQYLYALRNRPPGYATVPSRWEWGWVKAPGYVIDDPRHGEAFRRANPAVKRSDPQYRHGIISSTTPLTPDQLDSFEIDWLNEKAFRKSPVVSKVTPARTKLRLAPGSGSKALPPARREHGIPLLPILPLPQTPPPPPSLDLTPAPAPRRRKQPVMTEEEKAIRRELNRERRKPLLLPRNEGPYLIMGVPPSMGASVGSAVEGKSDTISISSFSVLPDRQMQREIIADVVCPCLEAVEEYSMSRAIRASVKQTDLDYAEEMWRSFRYEQRIDEYIRSRQAEGRSMSFWTTVRGLAYYAINGGDLTDASTVIIDEDSRLPRFTAQDMQVRLREAFFDRMQTWAGLLASEVHGQGLSALHGAPHDVIIATILRAKAFQRLERFLGAEEDFYSMHWDYAGPLTEDEMEIAELCLADIREIADAGTWVSLYVRGLFNANLSQHTPFQILLHTLHQPPINLRRAWLDMGPDQRVCRAVVSGTPRRRRRTR